MPSSDLEHETVPSELGSAPGLRRRFVVLSIVLLVFAVLALVPPLFNVSRFQRRVALNIAASLGRQVHFDRVALSLLPLPGFTLENFVVEEDPAFGSEPILRADTVRVNLRMSSLWHRRVEFSKISLAEPSVNLVHRPDGAWNLQSILLHAFSIEAAPTSQPYAGPAPRFPYVEATGARINFKLNQEKAPVSLTEADFALWLPEPRHWRFRLEAHPARTDMAPSDTGSVRMEGDLGQTNFAPAAHITTLAQIPLDVHGNWEEAQLGGISRLVLGRDAGLRGDLTISFTVDGALGRAAIATDINLAHGRRADFIPPRLLTLEATCNAIASDAFHAFSSIECHWPPADSSDPSILIATGNVPDIRNPSVSSANITVPALSAATLLDWLGVITPYPPTGLQPTGTLAGTLAWSGPDASVGSTPLAPTPGLTNRASTGELSGELEFSGGSVLISPDRGAIPLNDIVLRSRSPKASVNPQSHAQTPNVSNSSDAGSPGFELLPITLPLGGRQPAVLEGYFDARGYTLHLTGNVLGSELAGLGHAIPQFGGGLDEALLQMTDSQAEPCPAGESGCAPDAALPSHPIRVDLTATREWGGPQTWRQTAPPATHPRLHATAQPR
jgi:AsmA protein